MRHGTSHKPSPSRAPVLDAAEYRTLLNSIKQGFCIVEVLFNRGKAVDYRFVEVNDAFERESGLVNAAGRRMRELRPKHEQYWFERYGRVVETGDPLRFESFAEALGGRWFDVQAFRVGEPEKRLVAILFKDITARKHAAALAAAHQAQLEALFDASPFGVLLLDNQFRLIKINAFARRTSSATELIGVPFDQILRRACAEEIALEFETRFRHTLQTGVPYVMDEIPVRRPDKGVTEYYSWRIHRIPLYEGEFGVVCHFQDISDQVKNRSALLEADRRKDEFLATLAHELRNPLAALSSAAQLLSKSAQRPAVANMAHDALHRQVDQMARLLDDLLDVARITHGRLELRKNVVDIESVLDIAIETARPVIELKQHHLEVQFSEEPIFVLADPVRLAQVIANLLTNAAKYSDAGSHITVVVRSQSGSLFVHVKDQGIGLSSESMHKIFEMFAQEQSAMDRSQGGLGIGLALANGIMQLHDGSITVHSEGLGKGSEFIIRLPRVDAPAKLERTDANRETGVARPKTILLADDNADAVQSLAMLLRDEGHNVHVAFDGEEALRESRAHHPDVIILDIGMPLKNGYDTARELREEAWMKHGKLIAMSGWGREEDRESAFAAGFDRHLTKPVTIDELLQAIQET